MLDGRRIALALGIAQVLALGSADAARATTWTAMFGDEWGNEDNWDDGVPALLVTTVITVSPAPTFTGGVATGNLTLDDVDFVIDTTSGVPNSLRSGGRVTIGPGATVFVSGGHWDAGLFGTANRTFDVNGILEIDQGGVVESLLGSIGSTADFSGRATVRGPGSLWDQTGGSGAQNEGIAVGGGGGGVLEVLNGGTVRCIEGYVGSGITGVGEALVSGNDALWEATRFLEVGRGGVGTLEILDRGTVRSGDDAWIGESSDSEGSVTVLGEETLLEVGFGNLADGVLTVGLDGKGTLTIGNGGDVASWAASVGDQPVLDAESDLVQNGTVSLGSEGSIWQVGLASDTDSGLLRVGRNGKGALDVALGARLAVRELQIGGEVAFDITDTTDGGEGAVAITGPGSRLEGLSAGTGARLFVGIDGKGSLDLGGGASAHTGNLWIGGTTRDGGNPLSEAAMTVRDGATLTANGVNVGNTGLAQLTVSGGSTVTSGTVVVGYQVQTSGGRGEVLATGAGTRWTNGGLQIGATGAGRMRIEAGAVVTGGGTLPDVDEVGELVVTGAGSSWTPGNMIIEGVLTIADGATVTSGFDSILGTVAVSGAGARWTGTQIDVGGTAPGAASVAAGGRLEVNGRLRIQPNGVLTLEPGGVVRADSFENLGTLVENGGTLLVPEPDAAAAAALVALALVGARRRPASATAA